MDMYNLRTLLIRIIEKHSYNEKNIIVCMYGSVDNQHVNTLNITYQENTNN